MNSMKYLNIQALDNANDHQFDTQSMNFQSKACQHDIEI